VDQGTGTVLLRAIFRNPDRRLLPGLYVREALQEGINEQALLVPQQAVSHNPRGDATVLVVGPGDKAMVRSITTERAIGDKWLVTAGVSAGDRVIVEGTQKARPGTQVRPSEISTTKAANVNTDSPG
jgi:membrane fusion protein (multidrug efflux system)